MIWQELSLRMERMTDESHKKRKHLEHEMTETLTAQVRNSLSSFEFVNLGFGTFPSSLKKKS